MPYIQPVQAVSRVNFLASENFQSFTTLATQASVPTVNGVKKLPAGTIYPANGATAKGILLHDIDVTLSDQPVALIVAGWILKDRLPAVPDAAAITALKDIRFQ